ncbi:MAG: hypothetical protein AB1847_17560 [bacterium]
MLNGDQLGQELTDVLLAGQTGLSAEERALVLNKWQAIGRVIVSYIQTNAQVQVSTTGTTGTGPNGGPLPITSQPGVGVIL